MRDIREDIAERLSENDAEMASAKSQYDTARRMLDAEYAALFDDISERRRSLTILEECEARRMGEAPKRRAPSPSAMKLPLVEYILHLVGSSEKTKDEIKDAVDIAGYEGAGRTVHTTLLNMVRANKLTVQGDVYRLPGLGVLLGYGTESPPPLNKDDGPLF